MLFSQPKPLSRQSKKGRKQPHRPQINRWVGKTGLCARWDFQLLLDRYQISRQEKANNRLFPNQADQLWASPFRTPKTGARYDLMVSLDQGSGRKVRAETLDEETLLLQMGSNAPFRKKLAAAKRVDIGSPSNTISLMSQTSLCVSKILNPVSLPNLRPRTKKRLRLKTTPGATQSHPDDSRFTDIVPLSMEGIPEAERPADFMWKTGDILSGVRERSVPTDKVCPTWSGFICKV